MSVLLSAYINVHLRGSRGREQCKGRKRNMRKPLHWGKVRNPKSLITGEWTWTKTSTLRNKKTSQKWPSLFFFFFSLFSPCSRFKFPALSLFYILWYPQTFTQRHSHTGGGPATCPLYWTVSRGLSFTSAKSLQLCPALCDPEDCSPPGSSVHEDSPGKDTGMVAMPFSRGSSWPRDRTLVFYVSCIGRRVLSS